jgi:multiple sugar transport system permease protein
MSFIFSWNQFLFSLILSVPKTKTVPVAVYNFISYGKIDWAGIGAAASFVRRLGEASRPTVRCTRVSGK